MTPGRRLLVVQHEDECPPAAFGEWLAGCGVELDVARPYAGDVLPARLDRHAGLLVLGGSMGAYDDAKHYWLAPTRELLRSAVADGVPALGICLGHQLLTVACGGRVEPNPVGRRMGVVELALTADGRKDELLRSVPVPAVAARWNRDIAVRLPPDAELLAVADEGVTHAIRVGPNAWGVQFHPEATASLVGVWAHRTIANAATAGDERTLPAVDAGLAAVRKAEPVLVRTWQRLAAAFARRL